MNNTESLQEYNLKRSKKSKSALKKAKSILTELHANEPYGSETRLALQSAIDKIEDAARELGAIAIQ